MVTSSSHKTRSQGRPEANASVGRQALIDAAIEELRLAAPEALTLRGIAARADVDPALIRYYFGDKDGLLREVVHTLVQQGQEASRLALESEAPLKEKLMHRLDSMIDLIQKNPHFHRLVIDKIYKNDEEAGRELLSLMATRGMHLTASLLYENEPGMQLKAIDPRFLHVAIIGLTEFFAGAEPLLKELFTETDDMDVIRQRYIAFLSDLLLQGLLVRPE